MELKLFIMIPILGAFIGWVTNLIAIKLIFRPYEPIKIPVINFAIQGLIPKKRYEISANISKIIEAELLSTDDLIPIFENSINDTEFIKNIASIIKSNIVNKIPGICPTKLKEILGKVIEDVLAKELAEVLPELTKQGLEKLSSNIDIRGIVEEKINNLELAELENLVLSIAGRELKHIEYLGGVLGFIIGIGQVLIIKVLFM